MDVEARLEFWARRLGSVCQGGHRVERQFHGEIRNS